jgi:phage terminase small subunit
MARGRKAKPDATKLAQGNPGKRAIRKPKPVLGDAPRTAFASREDFPPPSYLGAEEAAIWREEIRRIENLNLLRESDVSAFEVYVSTVHRWRQAKRVRGEQGMR